VSRASRRYHGIAFGLKVCRAILETHDVCSGHSVSNDGIVNPRERHLVLASLVLHGDGYSRGYMR
jgi:hypothetical protein